VSKIVTDARVFDRFGDNLVDVHDERKARKERKETTWAS